MTTVDTGRSGTGGTVDGKGLKGGSDLLLEPAVGSVAPFGLPDSGGMPTVISPDLSNLPAGERGIDPNTGEEFTRNG